MTGPYLASNPLLVNGLRACDALLRLLRTSSPSSPLKSPPRRILLALGGHLGDAVVATAAIEYLRRSMPDAELGVVLPSWSRAALEGDPRIRWLHSIDHWKANRTARGWFARWNHYRGTLRRALREVREVRYDVAVDLYGYFPNMALALWRTGIPVRVGFTSGGLGPLYSHPVAWVDDLSHVAARQVDLVSRIAPKGREQVPLRYALHVPTDSAAFLDADRLAASHGLTTSPYILVHMGSGAHERKWPTEAWKRLARRLVEDGHTLLFTGRGPEEAATIAAVSEGLPRAINLCDRLTWSQFVHAIQGAEAVVTVETAAAHVASAVDTPCIAIWSGITSRHHWGPIGRSVSLVTHSTSCAPCFRSHGCAAMSCIRELTVTDVYAAVQRMLSSSGTATPEAGVAQ
jgi:ADP-heptose:LPS heptosyltransferase